MTFRDTATHREAELSLSSVPHCARQHASFFALELLANERSIAFDRCVVRAIYRIGWRDLPHATAAEWALLPLVEHLLELVTPDLVKAGAAGACRTDAPAMLQPVGDA